MSTLEEFARSRGYVIRVDRGPRGDEAPVREFVHTSADVAEIAQLQARVAELEELVDDLRGQLGSKENDESQEAWERANP